MCKVTPPPAGAAPARSAVLGGSGKSSLASSGGAPSAASSSNFLSLGYAVIADFLNSNSKQAAVEKSRSSVPCPPPRKDGRLTMAHVAAHHRDGDAWVAIKSKVRMFLFFEADFSDRRRALFFLLPPRGDARRRGEHAHIETGADEGAEGREKDAWRWRESTNRHEERKKKKTIAMAAALSREPRPLLTSFFLFSPPHNTRSTTSPSSPTATREAGSS